MPFALNMEIAGSIRRRRHWIIHHTKSLGLRWDLDRGFMGAAGHIIASATEQDIFTALHLDFVPRKNAKSEP